MNYEIMLDLKKAGFNLVRGDVSPGYQTFQVGADVYREPTLSELIEACGFNFISLQRIADVAYDWRASSQERFAYGETMEEAVALLWFNLKENGN